MIDAVSMYNSVKREVNSSQNGSLTTSLFNSLSMSSELMLADFLTGDVQGLRPPEPYANIKNRDWLANLTTSVPFAVSGGKISLPSDYYRYENQYVVSSEYTDQELESDCEKIVEEAKVKNKRVDLVGLSEFSKRRETHIRSLKPSMSRPISKMIDGGIEYDPSDIGNVVLEYIRLPKFAKIVSTIDPVYNIEVPDPVKSVNYEWHVGVYGLLKWIIVDSFYNTTREKAGKEFNIASKNIRG